jgi:hypothetical protein
MQTINLWFLICLDNALKDTLTTQSVNIISNENKMLPYHLKTGLALNRQADHARFLLILTKSPAKREFQQVRLRLGTMIRFS